MFIPHFTFISGEEPYHGCTDIKPLLLLFSCFDVSEVVGQKLSTSLGMTERSQKTKVLFEPRQVEVGSGGWPQK